MRQSLLFILTFTLSVIAAQNSDSPKEKHADSLLTKAFSVFYTYPDSSQYYTNLALIYADKNNLPVQKGRAWHSLARTEVLRGDIEPALKHLRDAASLFEKQKQFKYLAKCYSLMSVAVGKINNHKESVNLLLKAEKLHKEENDTSGLRSTYVNLANTYSKLNEYDKALDALNASKKYSKQGEKDWYYYYINSGLIHENKKNYGFAKSQYDSCLLIARRHKMIDAEVTAATKIAELYYATKQYPQAEEYFTKAIAMSRQNNLPIEESEALEGLLAYYVATGNYKEAYTSKLRLDKISDSLFNIEKIKNINAVEARLKVSEKEKTIALQKLDMEKSLAEKEKSQRNLSFVVAGAIVLALILFLTIYVYIKTRRQKKEVEIQKARAEKLNSLNQKIFAVIAHDFKSPMITLNMLLDLMENENISAEELRSYSADVRHQLIQSGQILENLLNWARTELKLSPDTTQEANPQAVAEEIIKELDVVRAKKNITFQNDIPASMQVKIPADILKIIIRNLLSNAVKFSYSGGRIILGLEPTATLFIKDSGSGISETKLKQLFGGTVKSEMGTFNETGFGLGLYITNELIHKFKGTIWVESRENSGTVFKFVFPAYE
ncbi:MAG: tetratricopeptide repeat-containing sensor histidine kinase [Bacteroidia bacterium]|nr:tetratricopeptide repeat-containing sensor histidine kinase [Bacteroidia bacterium]